MRTRLGTYPMRACASSSTGVAVNWEKMTGTYTPAATTPVKKPTKPAKQVAKKKKLAAQAAKKKRPAKRATKKQSAPQATPKEETDLAIELGAQELRKNPGLKRDELYDRLFGPKDKRAPSLKKKKWVIAWTRSRFRRKVWPRARERAGLDVLAPKGRRPE